MVRLRKERKNDFRMREKNKIRYWSLRFIYALPFQNPSAPLSRHNILFFLCFYFHESTMLYFTNKNNYLIIPAARRPVAIMQGKSINIHRKKGRIYTTFLIFFSYLRCLSLLYNLFSNSTLLLILMLPKICSSFFFSLFTFLTFFFFFF